MMESTRQCVPNRRVRPFGPRMMTGRRRRWGPESNALCRLRSLQAGLPEHEWAGAIAVGAGEGFDDVAAVLDAAVAAHAARAAAAPAEQAKALAAAMGAVRLDEKRGRAARSGPLYDAREEMRAVQEATERQEAMFDDGEP